MWYMCNETAVILTLITLDSVLGNEISLWHYIMFMTQDNDQKVLEQQLISTTGYVDDKRQ